MDPKAVQSKSEPKQPKSLIEWESIGGAVARAAVPGGWLVRDKADNGGMAFVPDPDHKWQEKVNV